MRAHILVDGNAIASGHATGLSGYDEPGIEWQIAVCSCGWRGPDRVWLEDAALDAAIHLVRPDDRDYRGGAAGPEREDDRDVLRYIFSPGRQERIRELSAREAGRRDAAS